MQKKQTTSAKQSPANAAGSNAVDNAPSALEERLLNVMEVARLLQVSRSTIYKIIRRGDLPALRVGARLRFRPRDVQGYIRSRLIRRNNVHGAAVSAREV